jgi:hypothetical protein
MISRLGAWLSINFGFRWQHLADCVEKLSDDIAAEMIIFIDCVLRLERTPDYSATLAQITEALKATLASAARIEKSPAVRLSPDAMSAEIIKAGETARSADAQLIHNASDALSRGCGQIDLMIGRGQAVRRRWHERAWIAAGGVLAGIILWSFLPGTVARAMPEDYALPQRLAARMIGTDLWNAGEVMMNSADPVRWRKIVTAAAQEPQGEDISWEDKRARQ